MMETAIRLRTRVLPGRRIEVSAPELTENEEVELIVLSRPRTSPPGQFASAWEYLQSLAPVTRTPAQWDEVERELRDEKESWEN